MTLIRTGLAIFAVLVAAQAYAAEGSKIHISAVTYGDFPGKKICTPILSMCEGRSKCSFDVDDSLCQSGADTSRARNLEVIWDCSGGGQKHARAAARGTKMDLMCPYDPHANP
jgi:hypothetical protein